MTIDSPSERSPCAPTARPLWLFWTGGYYDHTTPVYGAEYSFDQLSVDPARTTRVVLAGAHSVFADSANRRVLADKLRTWVR